MKRFFVLALALTLLLAAPTFAFAVSGGMQNQTQARGPAAPADMDTPLQLQTQTQTQTQAQAQAQAQDPKSCEFEYQRSFEYSNQCGEPEEPAQHQEQVRTENAGAESNVEVRYSAVNGDEESGESTQTESGDSIGAKIRNFFSEVWTTVTSLWRG